MYFFVMCLEQVFRFGILVSHSDVSTWPTESTALFTDIRASTPIWENVPEGMRAGLQIHNAVMRDSFEKQDRGTLLSTTQEHGRQEAIGC